MKRVMVFTSVIIRMGLSLYEIYNLYSPLMKKCCSKTGNCFGVLGVAASSLVGKEFG